jgi:hypothetical protein
MTVCNPNNVKASQNNYICNPATGRWVLKSGKIGKELLKKSPVNKSKSPLKKTCDPSSPKANSGKHACNDKTGNWVLISSKTGKDIVKNKKSKSPQIKAKSKSPQPVNIVYKKKIYTWADTNMKINPNNDDAKRDAASDIRWKIYDMIMPQKYPKYKYHDKYKFAKLTGEKKSKSGMIIKSVNEKKMVPYIYTVYTDDEGWCYFKIVGPSTEVNQVLKQIQMGLLGKN